MLSILVIVLSFPSIVFAQPEILSFRKLYLNNSIGPESITFDAYGRGPYTSISDGRIVRYEYHTNSFEDFSFTKPNRSRAVCDGTNVGALGPVCGRPLGIEFYLRKNRLFIADAYRGLLVVGPTGGLARQLATSAEGVPFKFTNGLSVDQSTGDIYFTDLSSTFPQSQYMQALTAKDKTGRLLKYNQKTGKVKVLLDGLSGANGVAISSDGSFVLVAEGFGQRILKYWLRGDRAFTHQVLATFDGMPDNIRRTPSGDYFWVAFNFNQPPSRAIKIDGNGKILMDFSLGPYYNTTMISEFHEHGRHFFAGSVVANYVGVFN